MIITASLGLELVNIVERGNPINERVHFVVTQDCNLSFIIVMATIGANQDQVYPGGRPAYWFENREARTGDHVIIYTTTGKNTMNRRDDGFMNHFFYWGTASALFGFQNAKVVIAEINRWETKG